MNPALVLTLFLFSAAAVELHAEDVLTVADKIAQEHLPYIYGSEDLHRGGLDCSGFVQNVFRDACGVELPNEADKQLDFLRTHGEVWTAGSSWTPASLQPGDLIFYAGPDRLPRESLISHVMIYCGNGIAVGAQGKGRQVDGVVSGVGYYHFLPRAPKGVLGETGERFLGHRAVFAYARLAGAGISAPLPVMAPPEAAGDPRLELLPAPGNHDRID